MFLRPRCDQAAHLGQGQVCLARPPRLTTTKAHDEWLFRGSITQRLISLSTLRSDGHPSLRKTRFPAAGPALPDGIGYPQGFNERFHIFEMILLSRASWRKVRSGKRFSPRRRGGQIRGNTSRRDPSRVRRESEGWSTPSRGQSRGAVGSRPGKVVRRSKAAGMVCLADPQSAWSSSPAA